MTIPPSHMSDPDRSYITARLGREPRGVVAVAARDAHGNPSVITNHPLQWAGQTPAPFPTLYWLIDPAISGAVSDLERRGAVGQIETMIADDPDLREAVHADHRQYAQTRWALLNADEKRIAEDHGFTTTLRDKGVGGTANFDAIKCLHMHAAYHLAELALGSSGTAVGRVLQDTFSIAV